MGAHRRVDLGPGRIGKKEGGGGPDGEMPDGERPVILFRGTDWSQPGRVDACRIDRLQGPFPAREIVVLNVYE